MTDISVGLTSASVLPVAASPSSITITEEPSITGTPAVGQTLTGVDGAATGDGPTNVSARQWMRGSTVIATGGIYNSVPEDGGTTISYLVRWSDGSTTLTATSAGVLIPAIAPTPSITIDTGLFVGDTLQVAFDNILLNDDTSGAPPLDNGVIDMLINDAVQADLATVLADGDSVTARFNWSHVTGAGSITSDPVVVQAVAVSITDVTVGPQDGDALLVTVVALGASDGDTVTWKMRPVGGGVAVANGSETWPGPFTVTLHADIADASYELTIQIDNGLLSNLGKSNNFTLDTTAPVLSSAAAVNDAGDIDWSVTSDETDGVTVYAAYRASTDGVLSKANIENGTGDAIDSQSVAASPYSGTFSSPEDGAYVVDMFARDDFGNESVIASSNSVALSSSTLYIDEDFESYTAGNPLTTESADWGAGLFTGSVVVQDDFAGSTKGVRGASNGDYANAWVGASLPSTDFYVEVTEVELTASVVSYVRLYILANADPSGGAFTGIRVAVDGIGGVNIRDYINGTQQSSSNSAALANPTTPFTLRAEWTAATSTLEIFQNGDSKGSASGLNTGGTTLTLMLRPQGTPRTGVGSLELGDR